MAEILPGLRVDPETLDRLRAFDSALLRWSSAINLVAPTTLKDRWNRHIIDSAQLYSVAPPDPRRWADLGSGGGLPSMVISILGHARGMHVTMVESDQRKAAFLRLQVAELGLRADVIAQRAEAIPELGADVVSARALAPLVRLLPMIARHVSAEGIALLPKGRRWATELAEARQVWAFDCAELPSVVDPEARILRVTSLRRKDTARR